MAGLVRILSIIVKRHKRLAGPLRLRLPSWTVYHSLPFGPDVPALLQVRLDPVDQFFVRVMAVAVSEKDVVSPGCGR